MNRTPLSAACTLTTALLAAACDSRIETRPVSPPVAEHTQVKQVSINYREVSWEELIPKDDLDALLNPPEYIDDIVEGSAADSMPNTSAITTTTENESRYQAALTSTRIKPEFDNQQIRIAGFIVPIEFNDELTISRFLFVPYFGACIHLPPPPPNQVIHGRFPEGVQIEALYEPFSIEGKLRTLKMESEFGTAAYSMEVDNIQPYKE
ncbi:DUF3299 domain-containing protein [Microbulbifer sp. MLAF003]|uniref:DUF3299 domain-containing protein n=1 Tax=Microbulbifer TaxID=48073 RepID=UPI000369993C|nr:MULTISPECIES: DUF3299 domain-containing protein [Microbulbifer]WHI49269.1 DUF3299 domain-containing protein [Microbulbifer sp. MLAF003]